MNAHELVGAAALILLTTGANVRYGVSVAFGVCIVGVVAFHIVVP